MNHTYSALALPALAMGTVVLTTTEAPAQLKHPGGASISYTGTDDDRPVEGSPDSKPTNCPYPGHPVCSSSAVPAEAAVATTPSDDTRGAGIQLGASALGGAALAFGGVWLYRRHTLAD